MGSLIDELQHLEQQAGLVTHTTFTDQLRSVSRSATANAHHSKGSKGIRGPGYIPARGTRLLDQR